MKLLTKNSFLRVLWSWVIYDLILKKHCTTLQHIISMLFDDKEVMLYILFYIDYNITSIF